MHHSRPVQPYSVWGLAPFVALVLIWWVFTPPALRLATELQHARPRLPKALRKSNTARGHNCTPIIALSPVWEKDFLVPSVALSTEDAFDIVCRLDRNDTLDEVPQKKQKVATGLLLDKLHKQDFPGPLSCRASKVLDRSVIVLLTSCTDETCFACFPCWVFLRILCNGLCTAQRFHTEGHAHTCRVRCPNEPDSLSHYNECPRLHIFKNSFWRHATVLPQRNRFLHDLITREFLRSLQYGIVVMGFLDVFMPIISTVKLSKILGTLVIA